MVADFAEKESSVSFVRLLREQNKRILSFK